MPNINPGDNVTISSPDGTSVTLPASAISITLNANPSQGFASSNQWMNQFSTVQTGQIYSSLPKIPCQHVTSETLAEYIDGTVYATCELCAERIKITRLPAGLALIAARHLVAVATDEITDEVLGLLNDLGNQLEANRQALEEFEGLIELARQMVKASCE